MSMLPSVIKMYQRGEEGILGRGQGAEQDFGNKAVDSQHGPDAGKSLHPCTKGSYSKLEFSNSYQHT
jgi:hypothetical protein